ncbi:porin family protein [Bacteroidales bacterium OttesenSCG-928-M11]|nr:porin family protein [Bacteroidales bacterium OttesenSCG-928-M11]
MKQATLFLILVSMILLSSCAGIRVNTSILKSYPPLPKDEPVEVFAQRSEVPANSEILGLFSAEDGGAGSASKCDSISTIERLKEEVRKVGGNALLITEYVEPVPPRQPCCEISGQILNICDPELIGKDKSSTASYSLSKPRSLPAFRLSASIGPSWRTAKVPSDDKFLRDMKNGLGYDGSFICFFNDKHGLKFLYSVFSSSVDMLGIDAKTRLNNIGLEYVYRAELVQDKLFLNMGVGLGYADYKIRYSDSSDFIEESGSTMGFSYAFDLDYMLNRNLALGLTFSTNSGIVNSIEIRNRQYKETYKFDAGDGIGLGRLNLLFGLRYYF